MLIGGEVIFYRLEIKLAARNVSTPHGIFVLFSFTITYTKDAQNPGNGSNGDGLAHTPSLTASTMRKVRTYFLWQDQSVES